MWGTSYPIIPTHRARPAHRSFSSFKKGGGCRVWVVVYPRTHYPQPLCCRNFLAGEVGWTTTPIPSALPHHPRYFGVLQTPSFATSHWVTDGVCSPAYVGIHLPSSPLLEWAGWRSLGEIPCTAGPIIPSHGLYASWPTSLLMPCPGLGGGKWEL